MEFNTIRLFRNEMRTGPKMCPAIVSGIVTGDAEDSFLLVFTWRHQNSNYKTIDPTEILLSWCIRAAEN